MPRQRITLPCAELRSRYTAGQSTTELARHYNCSAATIAKQLRACGVEVRRSRYVPIYVDEVLLRRLYLDERRPIKEIRARLGVSATTISNKRRLYGIPTRPRYPPSVSERPPSSPDKQSDGDRPPQGA